MEDNQQSSLFEMQADPVTQAHLASISKWTRIIAVIGAIVGGLILLGVLVSGGRTILSLSAVLFSNAGRVEWFSVISFIVILVLGVYWLLMMFRVSALIKRALASLNTTELAEAFRSLKNIFIISIIFSLFTIIDTLIEMINL